MQNIMIVDHEEFMRNYMENLLWEEGYENAQSFRTNNEFLAALKDKITIDLVLLDIVLLNKSKWRMIKKVRAIKEYSTVPIIVTSTVNSVEARKKVFSVGADDYITKPFPAIELIHRTRRAISYKNTLNTKLTSRFENKDKSILSGEISEISVSSLFGFIEMSEISGKLIIESKKQTHTFCFEKGNIVFYDSTLDIRNIEELLSFVLYINQGKFQFLSASDNSNDVSLSPSSVILKSIQDDEFL